MKGMVYENNYSTEEIITLIAHQQSLNFQLGTEQIYCNSGYFLLAEIVKRVSGKSLRVFAEEQIFIPLKMTNTHFHDNFREIVKNRADGYTPHEEDGFQIDMSLLDCCGDGQLYTTIEDLLLCDRNFYNNILGGYGQDLIEEITTLGKLDNGEIISGAFGLQIGDRGGLTTISHGGSWSGYQSQFIRFPWCHFSVICLANFSTLNPTKLAFQVADLYLQDEYTEKMSRSSSRTSVSIDLPLSQLQLKTGFYQNPITGSVWELEIKDEKLMAKVVWMYFQLIPIDSTHFQSVDNEIDCEIEFPEDPTQMIVKVDFGNSIKIFTLEKMLDTATNLPTDYIGTYNAAELEVSYKIYLEDSKVWFSQKGCQPSQLKSIGQDILLMEADKFKFIRDDRGMVIGFDRCSDRVRRIHFVKQSLN
jgi:hypothetical protein